MSTKSWIWDNDFINNGVKVRDHCHITRKYRGSAHKGCNINIKINQKMFVVFHNLKNYDSHLGKLKLQINVISNRLEKYMSLL